MEDIQIVRKFKKNVQDVYQEAEIYFYGSRARKTHREDSDYDVLILLDKVTPAIRKTIYDIAWETGFEHDAFISPVLAKKAEFAGMSASPFFNNVKHYGIAVWRKI